jgi:phenylalanyl-tRNA synthetase alpha chain
MVEQKLEEIKLTFEKDLEDAVENGEFDQLYLKYFSRTHGTITLLLKELPTLSDQEKKELGPKLNLLQKELKEQIESAKKQWDQKLRNDPKIDLTVPQPAKKSGYMHPTNQVIREMNEFFRYYGFSVVEGPEIETEEYNFRKLNLPKEHPATDLQDTLYISQKDELLLRTHTSSIEARILTEHKPPIRVVVGGKSYRNETQNKTNSHFFHQYQGVVVDKGITIQHLKATLELFHKLLFDENVELRFRYKYYPEVSPGMGVDMKCNFCNGDGCSVCKFRGWIEVLGSGMIHYNTLKMCGIDPEIYTGFAFGMGLDRLVMQKFGIKDIRKLYGGGVYYI